MHVYYCAECARIEYKVISPSKEGCSKAPFHRWINLGLKGDTKYKCRKCKKEVEAMKGPVSYGCYEGVFHEWEKT
jgi:hypothetical protein